jgi:hypothetical protein
MSHHVITGMVRSRMTPQSAVELSITPQVVHDSLEEELSGLQEESLSLGSSRGKNSLSHSRRRLQWQARCYNPPVAVLFDFPVDRALYGVGSVISAAGSNFPVYVLPFITFMVILTAPRLGERRAQLLHNQLPDLR